VRDGLPMVSKGIRVTSFMHTVLSYDHTRRRKMKTKISMTGIIGILMLVLGTTSLTAQNFSGKFNENFPVFGFNLLGYPKAPTARALVQADNFINVTTENGVRKAVCESSSTNNKGVFTATILLTSDGNRILRLRFSLQSDEFTEQNYLTYLNAVMLQSGKSQETRYRGTESSLGQVLGGFSQFIELIYDTDKLFR
jgi:hypothetical protein